MKSEEEKNKMEGSMEGKGGADVNTKPRHFPSERKRHAKIRGLIQDSAVRRMFAFAK